MTRLNVGCGRDIRPGWVNLDVKRFPGVDVAHDLNKFPYPFKENTFDEILGQHVIEHVDEVEKVTNELLRILRPGGIIRLKTPHFTSSNAYADITHKHYFSHRAFKEYKVIRKKLVFGKRFSFWNFIVQPIANIFPSLYEDTPLRIFPALELQVDITK